MRTRVRWADVPALGAAAALAVYGSYLVLIGPIMRIVTPEGGAVGLAVPNPAGLAPVAAALLVWYGILNGDGRLSWLGAVIGAAFSILFLFSIGGAVIP